MNDKVPGVFVPEKILKRMEDAKDKGNEQEEGVQITLELIEKIKTKQGVHGIHLMAVGWEEIVPRIVKEAGLERQQWLSKKHISQAKLTWEMYITIYFLGAAGFSCFFFFFLSLSFPFPCSLLAMFSSFPKINPVDFWLKIF